MEKLMADQPLTLKDYQQLYSDSIQNPSIFWAQIAQQFITWQRKWDQVMIGSMEEATIEWFKGGVLNASVNCLDRHLPKRKDKIAIYWESDDGKESQTLTYAALYQAVCRLANGLKKMGIKRGDCVCIYMPMIPEAVIAMLACARIGAIHSVVFAGFSADALAMRLVDANAKLIITANVGNRGNKIIPLKETVDNALAKFQQTVPVIVFKRDETPINWVLGRDQWYEDVLKIVSQECVAEAMQATDPLFVLYTSGSTGQPKGIVHNTGGYLVYAACTFKTIFNYKAEDIYWCTADVGWITGHTYGVYGPLALGASIVLFEGTPLYPTPARFWQVIDKYQVSIFYTSPTAIRALRREGDAWVKQTKRKSLRLLGSVGESINPKAWQWYYDVVGDGRCPIVDTWWQTETGGILISPIPFATPLKPGAASWPFFGIKAEVVAEDGTAVRDGTMGKLTITTPWPGMLKTINQNQELMKKNYFATFPGKYVTGDEAHRDEEGYFWIHGRDDDVIKVSGHRIGTQEVESALLTHPDVAEAAVVAIPDDITGQSIYAYVALKAGVTSTAHLQADLIQAVRDHLSPIAAPRFVQIAADLPKTRSGKIMRRILQKIARNDLANFGDVSTLADPDVLQKLISNRCITTEE